MCIPRDSEFPLIGVLPRETVAYVYALYQETSWRIFKESLFWNSKKKKEKGILKSLSKQKDLQRKRKRLKKEKAKQKGKQKMSSGYKNKNVQLDTI